MADDGKQFLNIFFVLQCRGPSGDLSWGRNRKKKIRLRLRLFSTFFFVIKWYGHESIRTGLIKLFRPCLDRFEEEKKAKKNIKIVVNSSK